MSDHPGSADSAPLKSTGTLSLGPWVVGGQNPFFLISGPCVIESEDHCLNLAGELKEITAQLGIPFVFKASFDKANRTSIESYRGPGFVEGMRILARVKDELDVLVTSDVHETSQVSDAARVLDILQIPAFLCRQTDLVVAAAQAGPIVNIKKGQFLAPWDCKNIVGKVRAAGTSPLMLTERGVSFGYNNLVVDFTSLPMLRALGALVVFDGTHSVQLPGGTGTTTGGRSEAIPPLARAAMAVGTDGLFLEVHEDPSRALSDGSNALKLELLGGLLEKLMALDRLTKSWPADGD